jgi:hypothetical protein
MTLAIHGFVMSIEDHAIGSDIKNILDNLSIPAERSFKVTRGIIPVLT